MGEGRRRSRRNRTQVGTLDPEPAPERRDGPDRVGAGPSRDSVMTGGAGVEPDRDGAGRSRVGVETERAGVEHSRVGVGPERAGVEPERAGVGLGVGARD